MHVATLPIRALVVGALIACSAVAASAQSPAQQQQSALSLQTARFNGLWEAKLESEGKSVTYRFSIHTRDTLVSGAVQRSDRADEENIRGAVVKGNELTFRTGTTQPTTYLAVLAPETKELKVTVQGPQPAAKLVLVAKRNDVATER